MIKKQFNPDYRDLPGAFLTKTAKGKSVYRIHLNETEILDALEQGKTNINLDIPCDHKGNIRFRSGKASGRPWKAFSFYGWSLPKKQAKDLTTVV